MFRPPLIAALALLAASPSLPREAQPAAAGAPRHAYGAIKRIGWSYGEEASRGGPHNQLRFSREGEGRLNASVGPQDAADAQAAIASIARARPGDAISFSLTREAGTLACSGRAEDRGRASGTCRFDPDRGFAAGLARRGIAPDDSDELLAMTLVGAHLATVDGLTADGFGFDDAGDLIAVSALGISASYSSELRGAGLRIDKLGDLIAAKALKIDPRWLAEMARAGYPDLTVGQAIQMRALGVTPEYAVKMARVLRSAGEIE
jgi:hypothetical protein